ncbi:hypothetical protein GCM10028791_38590 [Echinicola sediminis]
MKQRTQHLKNLLNSVFDGDPWYGDAVMKKLRHIPFTIINSTPIQGTNTIAKLVKHLVNWRFLAIEVLNGNSTYKIHLNSQDDWPDLQLTSIDQWHGLLSELSRTQERLIGLLDRFSDELLDQKAAGREYTNQYLIEGIIQHDIYHLGQIALVAKQARTMAE